MPSLKFIRQIYQHFLPAICLLCGSSSHQEDLPICIECRKDLPMIPNCCQHCGRFFPEPLMKKLQCGLCLKNPPPFELTFALFPYQAPIIQLVFALKFHHQLYYAQAFGELMTLHIQNVWYKNKALLPDVIIPVPLHPQRLRERGFNQALEIAKHIAKSLKLTIDTTHVTRIKQTLPQSGLKSAQRKQNLKHAFKTSGEAVYADLNIAIIDDVVTTGYTVTSLAETLRANGAKNIHIWCCARRS